MFDFDLSSAIEAKDKQVDDKKNITMLSLVLRVYEAQLQETVHFGASYPSLNPENEFDIGKDKFVSHGNSRITC